MSLEEQILFEIFKENPWAFMAGKLVETPAFITLLTAIAFAITLYGISKLFRFNLSLDFGEKERAYNEGYLAGFQKAVEELSRNTSDKRMNET